MPQATQRQTPPFSQATQQSSANASGSGASAPETSLSLLRPGPAPDARILADTLEERAAYLELCIQRAEQRVSAALTSCPREEGAAPAREDAELLRPVGVVSQEDAIFVGRIAKDLGARKRGHDCNQLVMIRSQSRNH